MEQDNTPDGVARFTQDMELSFLCQKDQTLDLPLSKDPKIEGSMDVFLEVKLMCRTLNEDENKYVDE